MRRACRQHTDSAHAPRRQHTSKPAPTREGFPSDEGVAGGLPGAPARARVQVQHAQQQVQQGLPLQALQGNVLIGEAATKGVPAGREHACQRWWLWWWWCAWRTAHASEGVPVGTVQMVVACIMAGLKHHRTQWTGGALKKGPDPQRMCNAAHPKHPTQAAAAPAPHLLMMSASAVWLKYLLPTAAAHPLRSSNSLQLSSW